MLSIKKLKYKNIFNDINMSFNSNKTYLICGPNNSGKSVILKMIVKEVDSNNIIYNNKNINEYNITKLNHDIRLINLNNISFLYDTISKESKYIENKNIFNKIIEELNLNKLLDKNISLLTIKEKYILYLLLSLSDTYKILLIDDIDIFNKQEKENILNIINKYKNNTCIIISSIDLNIGLYVDNIYIINNGICNNIYDKKILEKDNELNKIGLYLPYMVDLSVKLKDYNILDNVYYNNMELIDNIWK